MRIHAHSPFQALVPRPIQPARAQSLRVQEPAVSAAPPLRIASPEPDVFSRQHQIALAQRELHSRGLSPEPRLLESAWHELETTGTGGKPLALLYQGLCRVADSELELARRCRTLAEAIGNSGEPPLRALPSPTGEEPHLDFSQAVNEALAREVVLPDQQLNTDFLRLFAAGGRLKAALKALSLADLPIGASREERLHCLCRLSRELQAPEQLQEHYATLANCRQGGLSDTTDLYLEVRDKLLAQGKPEATTPQVFPYIVGREPNQDPTVVGIPAPPLELEQRRDLMDQLTGRFPSHTEEHYAAVLGYRLEDESLGSATRRYLYLADGLAENQKPLSLLPHLFRKIRPWQREPEQTRHLLLDLRARLSLSDTVREAVNAVEPHDDVEVGDDHVRIGNHRLPKRPAAGPPEPLGYQFTPAG